MSTDLQKFKKQARGLADYLQDCLLELSEQGKIEFTQKDQKELEKYRSKMELGFNADPRGAIEFIVEGIRPFAEHILLGDDAFFLDSHPEHLGVDSGYNGVAQEIKQHWQQLTKSQQLKIKKKFQLLLMLGAIATRDEQLRQLINKRRDPSNPLIFK